LSQAAAGTYLNRPSVEGGGAAKTTLDEHGESEPKAKRESETKVTEAVPFGVASFTTKVTGPFGEAFTQAGGHPFALSTAIQFSYSTSDDGRLVTAGGSAKEVLAETPPGLTGDVQNAPQCPNALLARRNCPANTAVGYTSLVAADIVADPTAGAIVGGRPNIFPGELDAEKTSLVYNMQPAPGRPAAFGFVVAGVPFILEAKLRSNGDY